MKFKVFIIYTLLFISCKESKEITHSKASTWDFTTNKFEKQTVELLNGYDVFDFRKKSDSLLILDGRIFEGWKKDSRKINDTLKLIEKYFVNDSLNHSSIQILSYSNKKDIFFQLKISRIIFLKTSSTPKETDEVTPPIDSFDYRGKLFINRNDLNYFSENLWYK